METFSYTERTERVDKLRAFLDKKECKFLLYSIHPTATVVEECRWLMNYGMEHPKEFINNDAIAVWNGGDIGEEYKVLVEEYGYTFPIPYSQAHWALRNPQHFIDEPYYNLGAKGYQPSLTKKQQLFKDLGFIVPPKKP